MSGIYYALSIIAVFIVIRWCLANDKRDTGEPTRGLLAMRRSQPTDSARSSHIRRPAAPNKPD
jgi:hypothetical protein